MNQVYATLPMIEKRSDLPVYFYPYAHKNDFVNINQKAIKSSGRSVLPVRHIFSLNAWRNRKNNTLVLNWVEDQMYRRGISKLKSFGLFSWFVVIAVMGRLVTRNMVWVRHNYFPHNANDSVLLHGWMCQILTRLSTKQLCLEEYYGQQVIPHPLYLTDEQVQLQISDNVPKGHATIRFAFVGAIKSYKGIHKVLAQWPKSQPMLIAGRCDDIDYTKKLEGIIEARGLNVECRYGYMSDSELERVLQSHDYIVLAHDDNRMISSGTFYHAITYGCNLLCLPSKFTQAKASEHAFVHVLSASEFTPKNIDDLRLVARKDVMQDALKCYSRDKIRNAWQSLLSADA